jgi:DivIVA domain-containing protein
MSGQGGQRFRRRAVRRGYKVDEVDGFLDRVEATLNGVPGAHVAAQEVHDVIFRVRFGGYDEWQVDLHLDRVERQLAELEERVKQPGRGEALRATERPGQFGTAASPTLPSRPVSQPQRFESEPAFGGYDSGPGGFDPGRHGKNDMTTEMRMPADAGRFPPPAGPPPPVGPPAPPVGPPPAGPPVGPMGPPPAGPPVGPMGPPPAGPPPAGPAPSGYERPQQQPPFPPPPQQQPNYPPAREGYGPGPDFERPPAAGYGMPSAGAPMAGGPPQGFGGPPLAPPAGPGAGPGAADVQRVDQMRRTFQLRRFGSGYDPGQVDRLFEGVISALAGHNTGPIGVSDLDPAQFSLVPGGYYEAEVDAALREVRDIVRRH